MDFNSSPETIAFRDEVRGVLAEHLTDAVMDRVHETGTHHDWGLHRAMASRGWLAAALPEELGGQGRDADQLAALFRELEMAGAPYDGVANAMMVAFVLGHLGTAWQREHVLAPLLAGETVPCLGYSEPESGSDVAAASTVAERDGERWRITGQKMFTSLAEEAAWGLLLTRTNREVAKHRGLTFFLVPMTDPNVEVRPIRTLSGKRTNVTFYDGVSIGDELRVGEVDGGWQVMLVALAFERGVAGGVSDIAGLYDAAVAHLARESASGERAIDRPSVRSRLVRVAIEREVADLMGDRAAWAALKGIPGQEGAEAKLFGTEAFGRAAASLGDALGTEGLLTYDAEDAPAGGAIEYAYRNAPIITVAGGTSEIQKNLIAERTLGLPRRR
jgi:alkylation response protein AidB-like acyl-CoA dehydrogenase